MNLKATNSGRQAVVAKMSNAIVAVALTIAVAVTLHGCGSSGSSPSPSPGPDLSHSCSDPPLGVEYDIKYYSGKVTCGNVLLECDIGGTHPWIPPRLTFPPAEETALYTVMYLDFFVKVPDNGSWPDVDTPGDKAPARHWVAGNIAGSSLKRGGDLPDTVTVSPYKGPSPPWGSHPYAIFLFKQKDTTSITFEKYPDPATDPTAIYTFDYKAFIGKYGLGSPVASNWHVTQHIDPCPARVTNVSISTQAARNDKLSSTWPFNLTVSDPPLRAAYDIKYYNGTISDGTLILENDIGGEHAPHQPTVKFPAAEDESFYTLIYVDPDANVMKNGNESSWPDDDGPGSAAPVRHWVAGNINAAMLRSGDLSGAYQVSEYAGPSPPWGSHRYGLFLFKQSGNLTFPPTQNKTVNWDCDAFLQQYNITEPIASNWHVTQHDVNRPSGSEFQGVIV